MQRSRLVTGLPWAAGVGCRGISERASMSATLASPLLELIERRATQDATITALLTKLLLDATNAPE